MQIWPSKSLDEFKLASERVLNSWYHWQLVNTWELDIYGTQDGFENEPNEFELAV
jgi:hypothetical protein